jgi:hypothetical protein
MATLDRVGRTLGLELKIDNLIAVPVHVGQIVVGPTAVVASGDIPSERSPWR